MITNHSINIKNIATGEERNTLYHWHMFPAGNLNFLPPEPKLSYEETLGSDGALDSTEATADRVLFNNRTGEWEFYVTNRPNLIANVDETLSWAEIQSDLSNFLHGQKCQISLADDPNYYYVGRLTVTEFNPNRNFQHIKIKYDVEPYKYAFDEYDSGIVNVGTTLTTYGSPMPAVPTIVSESSNHAYQPKKELTRGLAMLMLYNAADEMATALSVSISTTISIAESSFLDVDPEADYYDAVCWAECHEHVSGYTDNIFAPENSITRAQFFTVLWRVCGQPSGYGNASFSDVANSSYYFKAVQWASNQGLTVGDGNGHFMPDKPITREQAIFVIWKLCGSPSASGSNPSDVSDSELIKPWYYDAVAKLKAEDIIEAVSDNRFQPGDAISRIKFVEWMWWLADAPEYEYDLSALTDISDLTSSQIKALKWAYYFGFVSGTSSTTFSPSRPILRKQAYAIFFPYGNDAALHASGTDLMDIDIYGENPVMNGYEMPSDVSVDSYYYFAVAFAIVNDMTTLDKGYRFNPDATMTRAMAAQMMYKFWCRYNSTYPSYTSAGAPYADVVAYELKYGTAAIWGYNNGILTAPFLKLADITVTVTNSYGTNSVAVPYGTRVVPDLLIADGENMISASGAGQYEVMFKRGSL